MKTITYLISANGITPNHSVLYTTFHNKQSHVFIRGFGALIPYLVTCHDQSVMLTEMSSISETKAVNLLIEPFYGGSHKQLIDMIYNTIPDCHLITMTAKKWHWRSRVAALYLAQNIPVSKDYRVLFCSSVLNLAELTALRPDLAPLKKIIYFHENQLIYPVREKKERDIQHGYNQILSCLVADRVVFNSHHNMESFLSSIDHFLHIIPDYRPKNLANQIRSKCQVIYFPLLDRKKFSTDEGLQMDSCSLPCNQINNPASQELIANQSTTSETILSYQGSDSESERLTTNEDLTLELQRSICGTESITPSEMLDLDSKNKNSTKRTELVTSNTSTSENQTCTLTDQSNITDTVTANSTANQMQKFTDLSVIQAQRSHDLQNSVSRDNLPKQEERPLHIVWAHRWEHDKGPESFFNTVINLHKEGCRFKLSVLGEQFTDNLGVFEKSKPILGEHLEHWGYVPSKAEFHRVLEKADVAVSTALHEFFGVSMLEAVQMKCYPLCPNRLVYPEIYPKQYLYNTDNQLLKTLRRFCRHPKLVREHKIQVDLSKFSWEERRSDFEDLFCV
ncbi:glycosyltransferase-like domain-containing protein 1 [Saccostrea echinata]|uniref:glycosyltransferase-like domain-containing protein 1 n=1 Tax=Saccostrea echinata TaxID=191078 RepID=UPI002A8245F7|nr:glycosyltransferase-like domain-containing protein 1 [Saccostrea echinata]